METIAEAIADFINHCRYEKNLSDKTLKAYCIDFGQFTNFLIEKNCPEEIMNITKAEIRGFLEAMSSLKPKSVKRKIAAIKAMFNYWEFEDKIVVNPFRKMKIKINEPKTLPKVMDLREVNKIFKSVYKKIDLNGDSNSYSYSASLRDIAVIELLFATGARVSEIANLRTENIDISTGSVTINGKGNKERFIQICNDETLTAMKMYQTHFRSKIGNSGGYFLINRFGNKLSDQSIRGIVRNVSAKAKIKKHITPHVFRHTLATLLLEKDVDIKYIQTLLGHSSIMTTQIYTHVNRKKQRQILRTKHPRRDFSMPVLSYSE